MSWSTTILLVEDDVTYRRPLAFILERRGHRVVEAGNLAEASAAFRDHHVDLVLADYWLPDGRGVDLVREERDLPSSDGSIPVIVMTSLPSASVKQDALAAGVSRFMAKPPHVAPILDTVEEALRCRRLS